MAQAPAPAPGPVNLPAAPVDAAAPHVGPLEVVFKDFRDKLTEAIAEEAPLKPYWEEFLRMNNLAKNTPPIAGDSVQYSWGGTFVEWLEVISHKLPPNIREEANKLHTIRYKLELDEQEYSHKGYTRRLIGALTPTKLRKFSKWWNNKTQYDYTGPTRQLYVDAKRVYTS
jgi:hypothetical protein